jgi:hypothetical protein
VPRRQWAPSLFTLCRHNALRCPVRHTEWPPTISRASFELAGLPPKSSYFDAIRTALETAGVEFIEGDGMRMRTRGK